VALAVTYERPKRLTWMITVSLDENAVTAKVPVPGARPPIMMEEFTATGERIRDDPAFQAALARRGITAEAVRILRHEPGDRPGRAVRDALPPVECCHP
jgi:Cu2+-containing amine oxidase